MRSFFTITTLFLIGLTESRCADEAKFQRSAPGQRSTVSAEPTPVSSDQALPEKVDPQPNDQSSNTPQPAASNPASSNTGGNSQPSPPSPAAPSPAPIQSTMEFSANGSTSTLEVASGASVGLSLTGHGFAACQIKFDKQIIADISNPSDTISWKSSHSPVSSGTYVAECSKDLQGEKEAKSIKLSIIPVIRTTCPESQSLIDGQCVQSKFSECREFVELKISSIPPRDSGICYYKKIIDQVSKHPSGTQQEPLAQDVIARRHYNQETEPNGAPFVTGDFSITLTFLGERALSLTSNKVGDLSLNDAKPIAIDNFILAEISTPNEQPILIARGTADAVPTTGPILVNEQPVTDWKSFAKGGTATVPVLDISSELKINVATGFHIRMLDCGGSSRGTDVFMIIH